MDDNESIVPEARELIRDIFQISVGPTKKAIGVMLGAEAILGVAQLVGAVVAPDIAPTNERIGEYARQVAYAVLELGTKAAGDPRFPFHGERHPAVPSPISPHTVQMSTATTASSITTWVF